MCVKAIALRIAECNFKKQRHRKQHSVKPCWEQAIVRGRSNAVWQLHFLKIATRSAFRSTLLPAERLETASERRMSELPSRAIHEQEEWADDASACRAFLITFWAQKVMIERITIMQDKRLRVSSINSIQLYGRADPAPTFVRLPRYIRCATKYIIER